MKKRRYQSAEWINQSLRDCIKSNYSFLDLLFGSWRHKPSRYEIERRSYQSLSQRHQIKSRFL